MEDGVVRCYQTWDPGIDEMPKSEIEKEKYGIHIQNFEKRKEKCRDLFSGSRREREFLPKKMEKF